jgi:hypothetical protein
MGVCLLLLPLVVAGFVNVPYYLISPGEARGVEDLIEVKGVPVFEPEGTVLFTTVALTLTPALCAVLLKPGHRRPWAPFRLFNRAFERVTSASVRPSRFPVAA